MESEASVAARFAALSPHLDERQRRLWVGAEARVLGRGGVSLVARATGVSRPTIYKALADLDALVDPDARGDPMSPLRWTCTSTGQLALTLTNGGHPVTTFAVESLRRW